MRGHYGDTLPPMRWLCLLALLALFALVSPTACNSTTSQPCDELTEEAQVAIAFDEAEAGADLTCTSASDCVVVPTSSACWPSCSVILTQTGAAKLQAAITNINATTCATFASDSCPANSPPSCATLVAACVNGACTVAAEDAGEDAGEDASPPVEDSGTDAGDGASPVDGGADANDGGCGCDAADASTDGALDAGDAAGG